MNSCEEEVTEGYDLVSKLVVYTNKLLNIELDDFFQTNAVYFDQDQDDLLESGQTLEQYEVFQKYEKIIQEKFDDFVQDSGYRSSKEVFLLVEEAVRKDKIKKKKYMEEIMERMRQFQQACIQNTSADESGEESKSNDEAQNEDEELENALQDIEQKLEAEEEGAESKQAEKSEKVNMVPMCIYMPSTLEDLVKSVLSVAEYQTFSRIMRNKVSQIRQIRFLEKLESRADNERKERRMQFRDPSMENLEDLYCSAKDRLLRILPKPTPSPDGPPKFSAEGHMRKMIETGIDVNVFREGLEGNPKEFSKAVSLIFHHVASLSSFSDYSKINSKLNDIKKQIPSNSSKSESKFEDDSSDIDFDPQGIAIDTLKAVHGFIDDIENLLFQQVKMHKKMRKKMLREAHQNALSGDAVIKRKNSESTSEGASEIVEELEEMNIDEMEEKSKK